MKIDRGLIIKGPWVDLILLGWKTWEIRSSNTNVRGTIGLIKSGSGLIYGSVEVVDSILLTPKLWTANDAFARHCVDLKWEDLWYKKPHAWVLANPIKFKKPIPYTHPQGAVIWVKL